jgi:hypothetical protein
MLKAPNSGSRRKAKPRSGWVFADQVVPVYDAIDFFGRQIRITDQGAYPFLMRARVGYESHEVDNSIADYTNAIRLEPGLASARLGRGNVRAVMEQRKASKPL